MIKEIAKEKVINIFNIDEIDSPFRKYFCYEEEDILGYFCIDIIYEKIELVNIFVKNEYRNRKIGTFMLKYLIDFARNNNIYNITLEVDENNIYAIKLYEKCGFIKKAIRKNYYNNSDGIL
ncbi:MAG: hypothetical protein BHW63_02855, partial [Mycoplasma sp. CAG:611_25_7]